LRTITLRTLVLGGWVVVGGALWAGATTLTAGRGGGGASSTAGAGAGSSQADCHTFCELLAAAPCPMEVPASECEQGCALSIEQCPSAGAALAACGAASGQVDCDPDGFAVAVGCDSQGNALDACEQSSGSTGPGSPTTSASHGATTGASTSASSGDPTGCVPPNVGACGFGVACCTYAGSGSSPASVPTCHQHINSDCCIGNGEGCSDDFQCCVGLACGFVGNPAGDRVCQ